ncbi:Lar family restriction alleviation protein [Desulfovibrio piger]
MSNRNDRSDAALQKRLELAKKATHGPWALWEWDNGVKEIRSNADPDEDHVCRVWHKKDGDFLAKNSPIEVQADIEEILRLREEVARLELENQRLSVDGVNGEAYLLTCLDIIRRAVGMPVGSDWQQVAERVERLNKESTRIMDVAICLAAMMENKHELCPRDCDVSPSAIKCNQYTDFNGEVDCDATKCWLHVALHYSADCQHNDEDMGDFHALYEAKLRNEVRNAIEGIERNSVKEEEHHGGQLKPCPNCGEDNLRECVSLLTKHDFIMCMSCGMKGPEVMTVSSAINAWNSLPRHHDISPNKVDCAGCPERRYRQGLVWTKEEPMHEGWYWWKCAGIIGIDFVREGGKRVLNDKTALWAGPIPLPQEATR